MDTLIRKPKTWRAMLGNLRIVPFETVIAFYSAYSGVAGILEFGVANSIFSDSLGSGLVLIFNLIYIIAGMAMISGVALGRKDIESAGLILVITSILVRIIAIAVSMGISPAIINFHVLSVAMIVAAVTRLNFIFKFKLTLESLKHDTTEIV
jgi:hypothetical protein